MATDDRTQEVKSYLGHPCSLAPLLHVFEDEMREHRNFDARHVLQRVGVGLDDLRMRVEYTHDALGSLRQIETDDEAANALAAVLEDYALNTANRTFELVAMILVVFERANLIAASQQQEPSHV